MRPLKLNAVLRWKTSGTVRFIKEQGLAKEADRIETESSDVYMNEKAWEDALSSYQNLRRAAGEQLPIRMLSSVEAQKVCYAGVSIKENTTYKH